MLITDSVIKSPQGALVKTQLLTDNHIFKTVTLPTESFVKDYSQQAQHIENLTSKLKQLRNSNEDEPIYTCSNRDPSGNPKSFGEFLPVYVTDLTETDSTYSYTVSKCFETIDFVFEYVDNLTFNVHIKTGKKKSIACKEAFLFANTAIYHPEVFVFSADHTLQFKTPTADIQADVRFGGIKVFEFCDGLV